MDEEIGKVGGSKKKLIAGMIIAVVVIASIGAYLIFSKEEGSNYPYTIDLYWDTENTENAWLVKMVDIHKSPEDQQDIHIEDLRLIIMNKTTHYTRIVDYLLTELNTTTNSLGISFEDINSNGIVNIGDYIQINKNGGIDGKIYPNIHELVLEDLGSTILFNPSSVINLPPADFLNMSVEKTSDGWNMTVTWVNETIPVEFLEGWRIGFRVENESEVFYGIQKFGWAVPLGNIESNFVAEPGTYVDNGPMLTLGMIKHSY